MFINLNQVLLRLAHVFKKMRMMMTQLQDRLAENSSWKYLYYPSNTHVTRGNNRKSLKIKQERFQDFSRQLTFLFLSLFLSFSLLFFLSLILLSRGLNTGMSHRGRLLRKFGGVDNLFIHSFKGKLGGKVKEWGKFKYEGFGTCPWKTEEGG